MTDAEIVRMPLISSTAEDSAIVAQIAGEIPYGGRRNGNTALALVFLGLVISFIDRMIISVMIDPLKAGLSLTDTDISLLQGFAFVAFYAVMTFPAAIVADRWGNKPVIVVGVLTWSVATSATAFSTSFAELFAWRILIGAGEAALGVAGAPILAAIFPKKEVGRAIGIYSSGAAMGAGVALIVGGALLQLLASDRVRGLLHMQAMAPWQGTLFLVGLPGILLAAIFAITVKEPSRAAIVRTKSETASDRNLLSQLSAHWWLYSCMFFLILGVCIFAYGVLIWSPALLVRRYAFDPSKADMVFGVIMLVVGTGGGGLGGWLSDVLLRRGQSDAPVRLMTVLMGAGTISSVVVPFLPGAPLALFNLGVLTLILAMAVPLPAVACQYLAPPALRAQLIAFSGLFENVISGVIGPSMVAVMNDDVFHDSQMIHFSFAITLAVTGFLSAGAGILCMRQWRREKIQVV